MVMGELGERVRRVRRVRRVSHENSIKSEPHTLTFPGRPSTTSSILIATYNETIPTYNETESPY